MSPAGTRRLARSLAALTVMLVIGGRSLYLATEGFELIAAELVIPAIAIAFAAVGALVASRRPRNAIGWIFLGVAVWTGITILAHGFVEYRLQTDADPGAFVGIAAVHYEYKWLGFAIIPMTFLVLLFPDGHLPSRRWRPIAWCAGAGITGVLLFGALSPERLVEFPTIQSPLAIASPVITVLLISCIVLMYVGVFGAVASVVVRYRRAGRVPRQQIKWLALAGAVTAVVVPLDALFASGLGGAAYVGSTLAVLCLPTAVGIAILRHRLYDIDVVINRALVYGALTATLAGTYLAGVLLLQLALSPLTESNSLAIAVSTLAVAALFQPVRRRIQAAVDRRFYRRKYDAARTLTRFGARLRDEVSLDALSDDLRAVVAETMAPAHVTLWLRRPEAGR